MPDGMHIHTEIDPIVERNGFGSVDVGDVQHIVPGVFFQTATYNIGAAAGHTWQNTVCAGNGIGIKGMIYASKIMAVAGIKALEDPTIIERAKEEFEKTMNGKEYSCPIPSDLPIPNTN